MTTRTGESKNHGVDLDVVIIGGGPAALSAALTLGRARRTVLVCDHGQPRNRHVTETHGFLTRDGTDPNTLNRLAVAELDAYPTVTTQRTLVKRVTIADGRFTVSLDRQRDIRCRRLLLCTGVTDVLPPIDGLAERWGRSIFNCPYCSAWEVRGRPLAVLGADAAHAFLACHLTRWSKRVSLCTNGSSDLGAETQRLLTHRGVSLIDLPIVRLEGRGDNLRRVLFDDGSSLACGAAFLQPTTRQAVPLAEQLGCRLFDDGSIEVDEFAQTSVPGVHAAGDCCRRAGMAKPGSKIAISVGQAVAAAVAIDQFLFLDELHAAGSSSDAPMVSTAP